MTKAAVSISLRENKKTRTQARLIAAFILETKLSPCCHSFWSETACIFLVKQTAMTVEGVLPVTATIVSKHSAVVIYRLIFLRKNYHYDVFINHSKKINDKKK